MTRPLPVARLAKHLPRRALAIAMMCSSLAVSAGCEDLPFVMGFAPAVGFAGDPISISGQGLGGDPQRFLGVIRDPNSPLIATATATALDATGSSLELEIDPITATFEGALELHLGQRVALAGSSTEVGGRRYEISGASWFEGLCRYDLGDFDVMRQLPPGVSALDSGNTLLMPDPLSGTHGINRCIVISSTPPPPCLTPSDPEWEPPPLSPGAFTARLKLSQVTGDAPAAAERVVALAAALNQSFNAFGLAASTQGDWLEISAPGLAGGFAGLVDCVAEP
ncbi:MAG: hypothetical protein AAF560_11015 [Acidobacteriota bacterium]